MESLLPLAAKAAARLKERGDSLAVSESSMGGLMSASLVAQPGASAYFLGGTIIYTREAGQALLGMTGSPAPKGVRPLTEDYVLAMARLVRERMGATWAMAEMGASGPSGSPYGPPAGTGVIAIAGPVERAVTVSTGSQDRAANMRAFAAGGLTLLIDVLG
ncbi:MAG: damage-inducible protein [Rhizobiales bacterium]|nr:damage-inducible protein [Hyphomicrobiales bacterium]